MDYKYIEQLLESYFDCRTTLQEEQILRSFFAQEDVPGHLMQYADLFQYEAAAKEDGLDEAFDQRIMALVEQEAAPKAKLIPMDVHPREEKQSRRFSSRATKAFAPFFKAAAVVAMALTIGQAAEHAIGEQDAEERDNAVAVDPYIQTNDIMQTIRVKDVSQAENSIKGDSLVGISTVSDDKIQ